MFSERLQSKMAPLLEKRRKISLGRVTFDSPLLLAPMAGICNAPFRLLMEQLGAGGTVSELISCHGINYKGKVTLDMLKLLPKEKNIGLQLFGEDGDSMARAATVAQEYGPKFIDINMGCPVRKVVTKGGGSALLREPKQLGSFFEKVRKAIDIPLTIKIRTGWDADQINADEIVHIAYESGIEWVAIHGRTRAQQYEGKANWDYIEWLAENIKLPLIGNGDLHQSFAVADRLGKTKCNALMLGRGPLRNPFIFLESLDPELAHAKKSLFTGEDYWEVSKVMAGLASEYFQDERTHLVQTRKLIVWFASGFPGAAQFRGQVFQTQSLPDCLKYAEDYFLNLQESAKFVNYQEEFMTSGHG